MGFSPAAEVIVRNEHRRQLASPHAAAIYTDKYRTLQRRYRHKPIDVKFRQLVGPLPADDLTHSIYPYPARLLRHIPKFILGVEPIMDGIECIVDPFCGSGTILVEAQRYGYPAIGVDQNPIAALVSRVKTRSQDPAMLKEALAELTCASKKTRSSAPYPNYLHKWYDPPALSTLGRITSVRQHLKDTEATDFLDLCVALLARRVSLADPRIPVPVRSKTARHFKQQEVWRELEVIGEYLIDRIARLRPTEASTAVINADSRNNEAWAQLRLTGNTLVFTSPPYGPSQKYIRSTSLEAGWLGHATNSGTIHLERDSVGREHISGNELLATSRVPFSKKLKRDLRRIEKYDKNRHRIFHQYFTDIANTFANIFDQPAISTIVLIAGDNMVGGRQMSTNGHLKDVIETLGFIEELSLRDLIGGRTLITRRNNGNIPTAAEFIRVFRR